MAAPVYSRKQVAEFLALLEVPAAFSNPDDLTPNLDLLRLLHTHMISTIPYETLILHYSPNRKVELDPQRLFQKIVGDGRGRGGYCLECNLLFLYMLRELGFHTYPVGTRSRIRFHGGTPGGGYEGWGHIVQIVTFPDDSRWAVDICFGGDGQTQPMALVENAVSRNMGTQDARYIRDFLPGQISRAPEHRMWQYQCRNSESQPWGTYYTFSDAVEWLPADFDIVNCYTGGSPVSAALTTMMVVKFLRRPVANSEDGSNSPRQEIFGKRMLVNELVKENTQGKTITVQVCRSEEERVAALKKWFGIQLVEEERDAIKGHLTELTSSGVA